MKHIRAMLLASLGFSGSCSVGPPYVPPCTEIPSQWKNCHDTNCQDVIAEKANGLTPLEAWWNVFEDEQLNALEKTVLENNRNLFVAYQRIQEYRALKGVAASNFYPQITISPLYTNTLELLKNYNSIPQIIQLLGISQVFRAHELLYFLPLNLSYEVDLWGKIKDQYKAAQYNWLGIRKEYESVMLTLTTNLAFAYYQLRVSDAQIDLLAQVLETRRKARQINQDRYDAKIIFYSDVALSAEEVDNALLQYNEVVRQRAVLEDQIAVLLGLPASEFCLKSSPLEGLPPCIPEGLPSDLLLRRPDIAEAEYKTKAQHALVKQAYTQFFPSLTLTAVGGFESPIFKEFLKWLSRYLMEGVAVNQMIFDGFATSNQVRAEVARFQEASGEYQQQVLTAFQEVEDALANLNAYAKEYEDATRAAEWAEIAYHLYEDRYLSGVTNYLDVVNTERDLLNFQITEKALQGYRYIATIQLIKALGGSWNSQNL